MNWKNFDWTEYSFFMLMLGAAWYRFGFSYFLFGLVILIGSGLFGVYVLPYFRKSKNKKS